MATLTNSYQFLGVSDTIYSTDGNLTYYLLLYGKTSSNKDTGIHTVTVKAVLASKGSSYYLYRQEYNGKIGGTVAFSGTKNPCNAWELSNIVAGGVTYKLGTVLGEGSINVDCTNGLAKDITLSCYYKFTSTGTTYYTPATNTNRTVTATVTLPAIARGATLLSAQNFSDEGNPTITYSNPAGESVTSLQAGIYDSTGYTPYVNYREISKTGTSYTFQLTATERATLMSACGDSNSLAVKFYIKTIIGSNTYIANPIAKTFSINDANPVITASVKDINSNTVALTGNNGKLIKYYSNAQATMSAEAQKGAAIDESLYIIRNGENSGYGTSHTFTSVESNEFIFTAEDSRGNVGRETITLPMVDYVKPTCNIRSNKPDGAGNMTVECYGNYFNGSFGAVSNSLTVQCRYRTFGGNFGAWVDMDVTTGVNNYFASASLSGLDYQETYFFEARITDKLTSATSRETAVKSLPLFHWGKEDFAFEVPVEFKAGVKAINGDLNVTGDLRLKGDGNYGNTLRWGDGDYCYISEASDDVMTIRGAKINLNANSGVFVNGNSLPIVKYGIWSPSLSSSVVNSYTTQYGWYSKVNQCVSVGFFIKANCASGYNSTLIQISGLPFTPLFQASGGGICSGAYVSAGFNFQCFVAETSGLITIRVQNCNNTSAQNLSTSGSGCWYPSGGGTLTLSGTITFMSNS